MKFLLCLAATLAITHAASVGYNYDVPKGSFDLGTSSLGLGTNFGLSTGNFGQSFDSSFDQSANSQGFGQDFGAVQQTNLNLPTLETTQFSSGYESSGTFSSGAGLKQAGNAKVRKYYYVYEAPEEKRQQHTTKTVNVPAEKRYNIIFIKTPNLGSRSSSIINQQARVEDKTIVYVLVKDVDEKSIEENIKPLPVTPPQKPQVVFIKYKGNKKISDNKEGISGVSILNGGTSGATVSEEQINQELAEAGGLSAVATANLESGGFLDGQGGVITQIVDGKFENYGTPSF